MKRLDPKMLLTVVDSVAEVVVVNLRSCAWLAEFGFRSVAAGANVMQTKTDEVSNSRSSAFH